MMIKNNYVGEAVAALEAAGINTFLIEADTRTVYVIGLKKLLSYLGLMSIESEQRVIYENWYLIEGLPEKQK